MSRIIKRYENRKLYDKENRKYISLEEIARLIRQGVNVLVVDNKTDADITAQTLTQVILEEGKKGRNPLSTEMLHEVIRWGSSFIDGGIKQVKQSLDHFVPSSLSKIFGYTRSQEMEQLKKRIDSLEELITHLPNEKGSDHPGNSSGGGK